MKSLSKLSDDSFLFVVPNNDPDLNPSLLEGKQFT